VSGRVSEGITTESTDPSGVRRFIFWVAYVLGTLSLLFSWALAQVPEPRHDRHLVLDFAVRSCAGCLILTAILLARRIWRITNPLSRRSPASAIRVFLLMVWIELVVAFVGVIGVAVSQIFQR
jgi:hypothetical protein